MKADLTDYNNQKKFNALYWGQPVGITWVETGSVETKSCQAQEGFMLHLKSVDLITEEEDNILQQFDADYDFNDNLKVVFAMDWLRSRGYAIPWMGLSIEEMVEAGWIKLITQ